MSFTFLDESAVVSRGNGDRPYCLLSNTMIPVGALRIADQQLLLYVCPARENGRVTVPSGRAVNIEVLIDRERKWLLREQLIERYQFRGIRSFANLRVEMSTAYKALQQRLVKKQARLDTLRETQPKQRREINLLEMSIETMTEQALHMQQMLQLMGAQFKESSKQPSAIRLLAAKGHIALPQ